jgi:hypothetical protein
MTYVVTDPYTAEKFEFEDRALAEAKSEELFALMVERESYPFTISKEVVEGNNTTWVHADLENDPEVGTYFVANPFSRAHDKRNSLSEAIAWLEDVKNAYVSLNLVPPAVVEKESVA